MKLFFEGANEVTRFFGLSLVRDFMTTTCKQSSAFAADPQLNNIYSSIRDALWTWTTGHVAQNTVIPVFILNNVVTLLTLLVKRDFPERWPSAFHDVLTIGSSSPSGLDLAVRILSDLEVEVVMYAEGRTKEEIAHNTLIKDCMRRTAGDDTTTSATSIAQRLVEFLCRSAAAVREADVMLSERCLRCLADLVGWVDVTLIACEGTLTCIYAALRDRDPRLCGAACACLLELVKKGMEPLQKIRLLNAIGLAQMLALVPVPAKGSGNDAASGGGGGSDAPSAQGAKSGGKMSKVFGSSGGDDEGDEDDEDGGDSPERELGEVVNAFVLELLGCWTSFETLVFDSSGSGSGRGSGSGSGSGASSSGSGATGGSSSGDSRSHLLLMSDAVVAASEERQRQELIQMAPTLCALSRTLLPVVLALLTHPDTPTASTVVPCLGKFITLLKQQHDHASQIAAHIAVAGRADFFIATDYLHQLLMGIYVQLQFEKDFTYDANDDDAAAEIEVRVVGSK